LLQAHRAAQALAPPDVIDGTYHVTEDRYGENPDFVRSQLRRGSPGSR
jgi:hypothetical protein